MMKTDKIINIILYFIIPLIMLFIFFNLGYALDRGPREININAQEQHKDIITKHNTKQVAAFPHHDHQDEFLEGNAQYSFFEYDDDWTCAACHHKAQKGEQPIACLNCKDVNKMLAKVGGDRHFEDIYHKVCRDSCHENMNLIGKKAGPGKTTGKKCQGCHNR
jgi:hypothetical protein